MFKLLKDAFGVKSIRNKIFFTLFILFAFRFGAHISVPGVNAKAVLELNKLTLVAMFNQVSGNALQRFSLFAMGVSPYITASILIQLMQMDIVPKFVEWSKQGEVGRRKLNQATRYVTLVIGFGQSIAITAGFNAFSNAGLVKSPSVFTYVSIGIILTAGTMLVTWMGEQISEKGVGNGVSMIIFAGIIAQLPSSVKELYETYFVNIDKSEMLHSIIFVVILIIAVLIIVTVVTYVQQAERKIPIQYTKRVAGAPQSSYLPLKVNAAGVIPVIFASSLISTPQAILTAFEVSHGSDTWFKVLSKIFDYTTLPGGIAYTVLIVLFTFFYAFVQVNPEKMAENLQKQGSYIPSVRPGKATEQYVSRLLMRLSTVGSVFLGLVAILPIIAQDIWNLPTAIGLGGTSLLIVISVALETDKQVEGLLLRRQYAGFIRE